MVRHRVGRGTLARTLVIAAILAAAAIFPGRGQAQLNLGATQRAADGTFYEVLAVENIPLLAGADAFRVTSIAGSINGLLTCSSLGAAAGQPASALTGGDPTVPQILHPFDSIRRTTVLHPNNFNVQFDPTGGGRLTVGTGDQAVDICRYSHNCVGGAADADVLPMDYCDSKVLPACIASGVQATCSGTVSTRTTIAFGLSADEEHRCLESPTASSQVCASPPADGFTLQRGDLIVFTYDVDARSGFSYGAAGFGIDQDGVNNPQCPPGSLVTADAQSPSITIPPPWTPTATHTAATATPSHTLLPGEATYTPTPTATLTFTPTSTLTWTQTLTRTITPTAMATPTRLAACTADPTSRATVSPTPTPSASATPTAKLKCSGDCDGDERTTVDELVLMVNISLELASASQCAAGDLNDDGRITIDEIMAGVSSLLGACMRPPTPTPMATPRPTYCVENGCPDLVAGPVYLASGPACRPGGSMGFEFEACVSNSGDAAAGPFYVRVNGSQRRIDGLAAGALRCDRYPGSEYGCSTLDFGCAELEADSHHDIAEADEMNNVRQSHFGVPTFAPTCPPTATPPA